MTTSSDDSVKIQANEPDRAVLERELTRCQGVALNLWKKDEMSAQKVGLALIEVRSLMRQLGRGEFTAWYREHGLDENRVMYVIRVAEGKVGKPGEEKPKPKPPTPAEIAAKEVVKRLGSGFFPYCERNAGELGDERTLSHIKRSLANAISHLLVTTIRFLGLELVQEDERARGKIVAVRVAVDELFAALLQAAQEKRAQQDRVEEPTEEVVA